MDAVTYPQQAVADYLAKNVIGLRIPADHSLAKDFKVTWTPTLLTLDWAGAEHHRTVGFLPADELIAVIMLGTAKLYFNREVFDKCLAMLEKLLAEYPKSDAAPEALFLRGVGGYKSTHNPKPLKQAYEQLAAQYPASEWTKRALPYRLL
jgi:hypothetical protein